MSQQSTLPVSAATRTTQLLACGIIAGPLFLGVGLAQAFTRDGFDLSRHPLSLLSLGDLGWVQIANFVVTGGLYLACAAGLRRALGGGRGGTWGPRLVGALGAGLVLAGVFVADAGAGFPPGAPAGAPEISWHGALHEVGFVLANLGMVAGCLVFARRFTGMRQWGWAGASVGTAAVVLVLAAWPDLDGVSVRLVVASAVLYSFVGALAAHLLRGLPGSPGRAG